MGSANFSHNSLDHCVEVCLCTKHIGTLEEMERLFMKYHASSCEVDVRQLRKSTGWSRNRSSLDQDGNLQHGEDESVQCMLSQQGQNSAADSPTSSGAVQAKAGSTEALQPSSSVVPYAVAPSSKKKAVRMTKSRMVAAMSWCPGGGR